MTDAANRANASLPSGLHRESDILTQIGGLRIGDYRDLYRILRPLCFPSPISTRFLTVERSCCWLLVMSRLKLLPYVLSAAFLLNFWPGDEPSEIDDEVGKMICET